jgi:hypothetical protein
MLKEFTERLEGADTHGAHVYVVMPCGSTLIPASARWALDEARARDEDQRMSRT